MAHWYADLAAISAVDPRRADSCGTRPRLLRLSSNQPSSVAVSVARALGRDWAMGKQDM